MNLNHKAFIKSLEFNIEVVKKNPVKNGYIYNFPSGILCAEYALNFKQTLTPLCNTDIELTGTEQSHDGSQSHKMFGSTPDSTPRASLVWVPASR